MYSFLIRLEHKLSLRKKKKVHPAYSKKQRIYLGYVVMHFLLQNQVYDHALES
jgi:hypothetical protein